MSASYPFRTKPFSHQLEWFQRSRELAAFAVLWEQGTGKSKLTVDTAAWLYLSGQINCVLVLAPNGVHRNWTMNEVPTHLPESVPRRCLLWHSSKANNVGFKREAAEALSDRRLLIVAMSYDAIMTKAGDAFVVKLLAQRKVLMVLDESARIKNPKAKRTIRVLARGKAAAYRRILTGTPVANSPFDVFTQFQFLNPAIWHKIGCRSFAAFKNFFGVWRDMMDPRSGRMFRDLVRYRNLNHLAAITERVGSRVTKAEVLDLPPKLYSKRYFALSPEQVRAYAEMATSFELRFEAGEVDAMLAIVQLLRFQQIVCGFIPVEPILGPDGLPTGDGKKVVEFPANPRLELLREIVEDTEGKLIIWAKFRYDIDRIMAALKADGIEAVRYDGSTKLADRAEAIDRFQTGTARAFVANPAAAGEGLTLHAATTVIYYNNSFKLTDRLQSEDRAHRIGQHHPVYYIDIVAEDTVDEKIVNALRDKLDVASIVTGDKLKEWI